MAQWHLHDIENSMQRIGWSITKRIAPSEKDSYIGGWRVKRAKERVVDFEGIFDGMGRTIKNPSLDKAYGCRIRGTNISLYFYKKGEQWNLNLSRFINELNELQ